MNDHVNTFTARGVVTRIARADHASKARVIVAFDMSDGLSHSGDVCILFSGAHIPPADLAVGDVCDVQFRLHGMYGRTGHERHVSVLLTGGRVTVLERAGATGEQGAPAAREETPEDDGVEAREHETQQGWNQEGEEDAMRCAVVKTFGTWRDVADAARTTVHMGPGTGEPSMEWRRNMLLAQHSPIRQLMFRWRWTDLPYWVSVHLVRHKFGIEHFVSTQRTDRTGVDRDDLPQDAPVTHECLANAEAIMFISRRRLCMKAANETRRAWSMFLEELGKTDPVLASCCVPECVYRGFCPERESCGFCMTEKFVTALEAYRRH